jgi:hypothetical protein
MDTLIANWEMSFDSGVPSETREEIATWPCEPYTLDWNTIIWN